MLAAWRRDGRAPLRRARLTRPGSARTPTELQAELAALKAGLETGVDGLDPD